MVTNFWEIKNPECRFTYYVSSNWSSWLFLEFLTKYVIVIVDEVGYSKTVLLASCWRS